MRLPYVLLLLLVTVTSNAQNLVPNGSFEQYTTCPTGISQVTNYCTGWRQYTSATSDYFHNCNPTQIPVVLLGWQYPAHGDGFVGIYTFSNYSSTAMWKEYVATAIPPLSIGGAYEVSMSVSLANNAALGCNDLGVYFYDSGPTTVTTTHVLPVTPQISYSSYGPIIDTANWVRVTATFTADSAYDNIVVGGFKSWSTMGANDTLRQKPGSTSYYYIDSVVIRLADTLAFSYSDTLLCVGDSIIVPFAAIGSAFGPTNVFTLQLSDASGSFSSPTTIATLTGTGAGVLKGVVPASISGGTGYRLRIVASSPSKVATSVKDITIGLSKPAKPVAGGNSPVCGGNTLFLTASTTTSGVTWQWTGPGFASGAQNPGVLNFGPANAGDYIVSALNFGCEAKDTITIAYQVPLTPITATNSGPVCECAGFTLSTTSSTPGATYSWTGPNSYSSASHNPSFASSTVSLSGDYIVTATLNGCSTKDTTTVLIQAIPGATASNNGPICQGGSLNLTATSTVSNSTFTWSGPSFSSTNQSPSIANAGPANSGTYTVTSTVNGCSSQPATTQVIVKPITPVTASNNGPVCEGAGFALSSTSSSPGVTYSWTGPNSYTSSSQSPAVSTSTLVMSGDYIVTASLNGCTTADTTIVIVKPVPVVTASNNGPFCEGGTLSLIGTSTVNGSTFSWSGPSGFNSTVQSPSITGAMPVNSGNYTLTATKDGCTSQPATSAAVVYPIPAKPVANANSIMCDGSPLNLTTAAVTNATYSWAGPNGFTSNLQNPTINPASFVNAGYYKLQVSVNGCASAKDSVLVTVNIIPKIGGYASPNDTICEGTLTTYVAVHSNGGVGPAFQWYKNYAPIPGATGLLYSTANLKTGDVIYCTMYSIGVCTDPTTVSTDTIFMVVLPVITKPSATITSVPVIPQPHKAVTFTAHVKNGGPAPTYQWQVNGVNMAGATYATWSAITLKPFDKVNVIITSNDPCATNKTASSDTITIGFPTTVSEIGSNTRFNVFPNPNNGSFRITASSILSEQIQIELVNTIGQTVYKEELPVANREVEKNIVLGDVASGIYLLKLSDNNTVHTTRLVIR